MEALGIDACRAGWVAVELDRGGAFAGLHMADTLAALIDRGGAPIGVDMPLGFPAAGWRRADALAAARLGRRRSSVFGVPPRAVWLEPDYASANRRCRELTGGGMSAQSYGLCRKLLEANALRDAGHALIEVHPELSFAAMNGGPLPEGKKSATGQAVRRALLAAVGIDVPGKVRAAAGVAADDVLDAAAVAWSARRVALGLADRVPDPPEHDDQGRPVAIWF